MYEEEIDELSLEDLITMAEDLEGRTAALQLEKIQLEEQLQNQQKEKKPSALLQRLNHLISSMEKENTEGTGTSAFEKRVEEDVQGILTAAQIEAQVILSRADEHAAAAERKMRDEALKVLGNAQKQSFFIQEECIRLRKEVRGYTAQQWEEYKADVTKYLKNTPHLMEMLKAASVLERMNEESEETDTPVFVLNNEQ